MKNRCLKRFEENSRGNKKLRIQITEIDEQDDEEDEIDKRSESK